jgi:hypothetical protein
MIGALAAELLDHGRKRRLFRPLRAAAAAGLAGLFLANALPLVDGRIGRMLRPVEVPTEFLALKRHLDGETDFYRVASVPKHERWQPFSAVHPRVSVRDMRFWSRRVENFADLKSGSAPGIAALLHDPNADRTFDLLGVKYVIVPPEKDTYLFKVFGARGPLVAALDAQAYLERVDLGTGDMLVYENRGFRPRLYLTREPETLERDVPYEPIVHERIGTAKYAFKLPPGRREDVYVHLSEQFHQGWIMEGSRGPLPSDRHEKNAVQMNAYRVGPDEGEEFSASFRPQTRLHAGLAVFALTLAACGGYLLKRRYEVQKR